MKLRHYLGAVVVSAGLSLGTATAGAAAAAVDVVGAAVVEASVITGVSAGFTGTGFGCPEHKSPKILTLRQHKK